MERVQLADKLNISRIVYGMWRIGDDVDTSPSHIQAKIEACLEQGISTIDQADIYGGYMAEEMLGNCLKAAPQLKGQIEIVTKCDIVAPVGRYSDRRVKYYDTSRSHILQSVDQSLSLMNIDCIDLLLIHRPDPFMNHHETGAALDEVVASGKVKAVGVSNFKSHDWSLLSSAMNTELVTNQIEISLAANDAFTNGDIAYLQERNVKPMAWSPLGGGSLFNQSSAELNSLLERMASANDVDIAAVAVAWLLAHPSGIIPVMGTNTLERIKTFSKAFDVNIDRQTWFELYSTANGYEVP
ncbi:aldo/keto reductase family oxidoreductase [Kordiimonas sp. SCSIO 12610]|uniref:aldo/keto reductase n=1 Tax=Kordiimonas sp. SCSIO 12610 TaxID=2829597 RepID=UPI002109197D|nr:aldo/keto reductase [Kordiimonas sp. SCSIO 12610]UTW54755.1 aldo/keto reductase [Kordiimonas sp. SCSIO 12610]